MTDLVMLTLAVTAFMDSRSQAAKVGGRHPSTRVPARPGLPRCRRGRRAHPDALRATAPATPPPTNNRTEPMDMDKLMELIENTGKGQRVEGGQQTLGYLADILALADPAMPIEWDTGHQFGNEPIEWDTQPAIESDIYLQPAYDYAESETAHPSCYRGYYSDCTFNCSTGFDRSTVGHVLGMVNEAIDRSFSGYKGGIYRFHRGTLVWGGGTSHNSTDTNRYLTGFTVADGVLTLLTEEDQ